MSKYVKVSLPQEFAEKINPYIESGLYRSFAEFVKEAIRLRLEQLTKENKPGYSVAPHVLTVENEPLQKQKQESAE